MVGLRNARYAAIAAAALVMLASTAATAQFCVPTEVSFSFSATPEHPRVGDAVELDIGVHATYTAGLPSVSLQGAAPLFTGGGAPDPPVSMSGPVPSFVTYRLTAVAAGDAMLVFTMTYEGVTACDSGTGPIFGFRRATSQPFAIEVLAADTPTPTSTSTLLPTSTVTPSPSSTPSATPTSTPSATPTSTSPPPMGGSGGCSSQRGDDASAWLPLLGLLVVLANRRPRRTVRPLEGRSTSGRGGS